MTDEPLAEVFDSEAALRWITDGSVPFVHRHGLGTWPHMAGLGFDQLIDPSAMASVLVHWRPPRGWAPARQFDRAPADRLGNRLPADTSSQMATLRLPLAEAAAAVRGDREPGDTSMYALAAVPLLEALPGLAPLTVPPEARKLGEVTAYLWAGPKGKTVPLHVDGAPGVLGQVDGRKRLIFMSPTDAQRMAYPGSTNRVLSRIPDVRRVDRSEFPCFEPRALRTTVLVRGDLVFVPQGWWHQVVYEEPSVSVNFWPSSYLGEC